MNVSNFNVTLTNVVSFEQPGPDWQFLIFRLKEYCERLMFYNPLFYGRKAEEVLWRKVYYDIIQLIKHNRRVGSLQLRKGRGRDRI